ncbi:GGDEF domain-containing protein [Burkholderia plantarii]|uniref:diguanylate cyclase n=1 Tax=Burkholderia plantarii TaxID=41899 RepID=A0A0B6RV24_BURPL|nr:GGDEF domain-containing protein [Burkholderia plantarii]AJK44895.1 diguanylate cyclase [Burkholderia plantarii]WLE57881.1 GGDEF domain-containing protein [Burkholderia plantarii]
MSAITVALATTALFGLVMLVLLGSLVRTGVAGVREWFAANLLLSLSLALLLARGRIPDVFTVVLGNGMFVLSGVTLYAGYARFLDLPPRWPWLGLLTGLTLPALVYWHYVADSIPMRVGITTLYTAIVCFAIAAIVIRRYRSGQSRYPYVATAGFATLFAISQVLRGAYFIMLPGPAGAQVYLTTFNISLLCVGAAIMPVMSMCAIMMVHDSMQQAARRVIDHDFLTRALSRQRFEVVARARVRDAERDGTPLSLLLIDLDHFKSINDTYGHAGGDSVLREFAELMLQKLRGGDALGRLGGEEFAILLPRTTLSDALRIADRLRDEVNRHTVETTAGLCSYSASGGLASRMPGETFEQLSARADRALYDAKISGRNRVCAHAGLSQSAIAQFESA